MDLAQQALTSAATHSRFVCPVDRGALTVAPDGMACAACGAVYPIVRGVPVLINDANSVFRVSDYLGTEAYQGASGYRGAADRTGGLRRAYRGFARRLSEAEVPSKGGFRQRRLRLLLLGPQARGRNS